MKTAAAVLQELAVKLGLVPEYDCISQMDSRMEEAPGESSDSFSTDSPAGAASEPREHPSQMARKRKMCSSMKKSKKRRSVDAIARFTEQSGPQHQATFEYRCTLSGESGIAAARSKKDAKQEAARIVLAKLARVGHSVPPPWGLATIVPECKPELPKVPENDPHSYVALLKEYCEEYKLPPPDYILVGDSGPPHLRSFTMRVSVGAHSRDATALTKKAARQMAAETIFKYLRSCLRSTQDFVEVDALTRSLDKKLGRFKEERKDLPWRPPLSQKISDYQCGLLLQFDETKRATAMEALSSTAAAGQPPEVQLACAASALGLEALWDELPTNSGDPLLTVELPSTSPSLVYMGRDRNDAASQMVDYLQMCLLNPPRDPILANLEMIERNKSDPLISLH